MSISANVIILHTVLCIPIRYVSYDKNGKEQSEALTCLKVCNSICLLYRGKHQFACKFVIPHVYSTGRNVNLPVSL